MKAAKAGNAEAQVELANFYEKGYGVPLNKQYAFDWYLMAARKAGNAKAQNEIGIFYNQGKYHIARIMTVRSVGMKKQQLKVIKKLNTMPVNS